MDFQVGLFCQSQEWFSSGRFDALGGRNMDDWGTERLKNGNWSLKSDCSTSWIPVLSKESLVCIVVLIFYFFLLSLCFDVLNSNLKKGFLHALVTSPLIYYWFFFVGGGGIKQVVCVLPSTPKRWRRCRFTPEKKKVVKKAMKCVFSLSVPHTHSRLNTGLPPLQCPRAVF